MTNAKKELAKLRHAILNCFTVANDKLPAAYQNKKSDCVVLARLEKKVDKRDGLTDYRKTKMLKARNIARLAAQVPADGQLAEGFDYSQNEVDELAQYRAECALVDSMVQGGIIDTEEFSDPDAVEFGHSVFYKGK